MSGRDSACCSAVVVLATLVAAGLLLGACGSSRESARGVVASRALAGATVDGRLFAARLEAGVVGIVYDPSVTRAPVSFRALFSRTATGRVAMIDSPVLGLQLGALALGYRRPAALNDAQLLRVTVLYEKRRDNFRVFWRRRYGLLRAFRSGKVALAAATESDAWWLREHGIAVRFTPTTEGGLLWTRPGALPPGVALFATTGAQDAVTVVGPAAYSAWLIAWSKATQPRKPGCG